MIREIVALDDRPDLIGAMWDMPNNWPEFMLNDPIGDVFFSRLPDDFPEFQLVGLDADGAVVAKVNSIPFAWTGLDSDLPDTGWDGILQRGFADRHRGATATALSLLEARIVPELQGTGLSRELLQAMGRRAVSHGLPDMFGPVRPTGKAAEPRVPMSEYAYRTGPDGLPADSWLRTHARLGARIVKVCPASMTVAAPLASWRTWTGLPLDTSGPVEVPGALVPVHVERRRRSRGVRRAQRLDAPRPADRTAGSGPGGRPLIRPIRARCGGGRRCPRPRSAAGPSRISRWRSTAHPG